MKNKYDIVGDYAIIHIHSGKLGYHDLIVDIEHLERLLSFDTTWYPYYNRTSHSYYGKCSKYRGIVNGKVKVELLYIHDFIFNPTKDRSIKVDHIDYDGLNNRNLNIRFVTQQENLQNRSGKNRNNKSGYRNVCWIDGYWRIQLQINKKNHLFPERFEDVHEAGRFAEEMRKKYYGEFAGRS